MDRVKYKLAIIFFAVVVAGGVFVVLSGFNQMIRPAGPVTAFSLKGGGPDVYEVEFLGEKVTVELPAGFSGKFIPREEFGTFREDVKDIMEVLKKWAWDHEHLIGDVLTTLRQGKGAAGD